MSFMKWEAEYSVGHAEIDAQHRDMIEILNEFFEALKDGQASEQQKQLLERFVACTEKHFDTEERELCRVDYHDLISHRRLHDGLRTAIADFAQTFATNKKRCPQAIQILKKRLVDHFQEADRAYARYFTKVKA
jgi:hemerythrin